MIRSSIITTDLKALFQGMGEVIAGTFFDRNIIADIMLQYHIFQIDC
jgi:hypothetical protein